MDTVFISVSLGLTRLKKPGSINF